MQPYADFLPSTRFRDILALSPDGRFVAYVDDSPGQFNLMVRRADGTARRSLTSHHDLTVKHIIWHPGGTSLVYFADSQGGESDQIYSVPFSGGTPTRLTSAPGVQHVAALGNPFSPDGRYFAYAANDADPGRQDVLILDLEARDVVRRFEEGGRLIPGHWSPDGGTLTIADWRVGNTDHIVYVASLDDGQMTRATSRELTASYWLGPWLADRSGFLVITDAGRDFTGLAILDPATSVLSWLDAPDWEVEDVVLSRDGRTLVWITNVEGVSQLRVRDMLSGDEVGHAQLPRGEISALDVSSDGTTVAMLLSTPTRPPNVAILDLGSKNYRWITSAFPTRANRTLFVEPALVQYRAKDGHSVPGYLYRPRGAPDRTGVVLAIHGGPPGQERPAYTHSGLFQCLAANGIAVLAPNVRGSTGYGTPYEKLSYRDWGGRDLCDFADAARFLRDQDWVDPSRIGLIGRSYGGFAVLSCVSRLPDFNWAAAVDWCGPSNLVTFTRSQPETWRSKVSAMIGDPDADHDFLMARSPVSYVDQVRCPLLVIQGANDPRVPKQESDQIVERLRNRCVDVKYMVFEGEGHSFARRSNQIAAWSATVEFLLTHLS